MIEGQTPKGCINNNPISRSEATKVWGKNASLNKPRRGGLITDSQRSEVRGYSKLKLLS